MTGSLVPAPRPDTRGTAARRRGVALTLAAALAVAAGSTLAGCRRTAAPPDAAGDGARSGDTAGAPGGLGAPSIGATVALTEGESSISGRLPPGAVGPLSITLRSASGALRAIGAADLDGRDGRWSALLLDGRGGDVAPAAGDRLRVADLHDAHDWTVPAIVLHFGRGTDAVSGTTAAGAVVDVATTGARRGTGDGGVPAAQAAYAHTTALPPADAATVPPPRSVQVTAAGDGAFVARLGDGVALRGDDEVRIGVTTAGLRLNVPRRVPFVRVSLHPGDVTAYLRPSATVSLTLAGPDGRVLATGTGVSDTDGRVTVWPHDASFRRRPAVPGDTVTVGDGETSLTLRVPDFSATQDLARGTLSGTGLAGAALDVTLWNPWYPGELDEPRAAVGADGRWTVQPKVAVHPATHYYVTEHLPGGDRIFYCYQVPMLHVAPNTASVGVQALYFADARLALERAGRVIATGRTTRPWVEITSVVLRDVAGVPVTVRPGDVIEGTLDGAAVSVDVGPLTAAVDPATGAVHGAAMPGAALELVRTSPLGVTTTSDAGGAYRFPPTEEDWLDGVLPRPGTEMDVVQRLADGHFRRARLIGPSMTVDIGTRTVTGDAAAGSELTIRRGADRATAVADAADRYTATLPAAAAVITGGEVVTLTLGAWSTSLRVLPLEAAYDAATGRLAGRTAGDLVSVAVWAGEAVEPERWNAPVFETDGPWAVDLTAPAQGVEPVAPPAVRRIEATIRMDGHAVRWVWEGR